MHPGSGSLLRLPQRSNYMSGSRATWSPLTVRLHYKHAPNMCTLKSILVGVLETHKLLRATEMGGYLLWREARGTASGRQILKFKPQPLFGSGREVRCGPWRISRISLTIGQASYAISVRNSDF